MNPAVLTKWKEKYKPCPQKKRLLLHFEPDVHPYVRDWLWEYAHWLRQTYNFPVRVHVYCRVGKKVPCRFSKPAYGVTWVPDDTNMCPNIRLACGLFSPDEPITIEMWIETQAIMFTFTHEIMHYFQGINGICCSSERGLEWQASYYAKKTLRRFFEEYPEEYYDDPANA